MQLHKSPQSQILDPWKTGLRLGRYDNQLFFIFFKESSKQRPTVKLTNWLCAFAITLCQGGEGEGGTDSSTHKTNSLNS